ncbi:MAG: hypothetical protein KBF45_01235 [Cyclobacteriaceae bacterium]|jgi:hypothetical protein|nr:hypothetical protein [Cyclobacteriaceae bacterium]
MVNLLFSLLLCAQLQTPFKPADEFELKINFTIEDRPIDEPYKKGNVVLLEDRLRKDKGGPLPYLKVKLTILKVADQEFRIRVLDHQGQLVSSKKVGPNVEIKIDWGFSDDIKDGIVTPEYTVLFISKDKKNVSRIYMLVQEDGTFLVNDEKRGKF